MFNLLIFILHKEQCTLICICKEERDLLTTHHQSQKTMTEITEFAEGEILNFYIQHLNLHNLYQLG
jgi:hypothetical protein